MLHLQATSHNTLAELVEEPDEDGVDNAADDVLVAKEELLMMGHMFGMVDACIVQNNHREEDTVASVVDLNKNSMLDDDM